MSSSPSRSATPFFLPGTAGDLFAMYHPASVSTERMPRGVGVIVVPPFAEEMNKSRRTMSLQARALADAGFDVLILDLYGTGDSAGDFAHARWDIWIDDVSTAARWLRERGCRRIVLLGLRFGALLATVCAADAGNRIDRLILWQPVVSGEAAMTQFLRTRIVADMTAGEKQTTTQLRAALGRGEALEVAGYILTPSLYGVVDALRLEPLGRPDMPPVDWWEVAPASDSEVGPGSQRVIDAWRSSGMDVRARTVAGPPFWATTEIATAPALIAATTECLAHPSQKNAV